jgi:hypothetical protein
MAGLRFISPLQGLIPTMPFPQGIALGCMDFAPLGLKIKDKYLSIIFRVFSPLTPAPLPPRERDLG